MSSLKVKGALFEQLASYSVMRVEKSIDRLYADLRAAGVRLPEIMGPVFEVSGYRFGGEQMQCFVSLAPEDPHRFAVAIRRPTKWSHPNWGPPRECRGLYRHAREGETLRTATPALDDQPVAGQRLTEWEAPGTAPLGRRARARDATLLAIRPQQLSIAAFHGRNRIFDEADCLTSNRRSFPRILRDSVRAVEHHGNLAIARPGQMAVQRPHH